MKFNRNFLLPILFLLAFVHAGDLCAQKKTHKEGITPEDFQKLHAAEDTLAILAFTVVNDTSESERFLACRALISYLVQTLKTPNSFQYPFDRLKSISIIAPPDSSFRIFSWQLFVNDSTYRYYGTIQMNRKDLKLYPLIDRSFEMEDEAFDMELAADRWYGAVYYTIRQMDTPLGRQYLLFGFDGFSFFEKRKVLDVLTFRENGDPLFGASVFNRPTPEKRLILQYSAEAPIRLNWDEQYQMILYDHLIPIPSPFGRGLTMVPDGSYEGFKIEKGKLVYVEKVFNDINLEVPEPEPVLEGRSNRDILGRERKKKS